MLRDFVLFANINDMHKVNNWEPNFPVVSSKHCLQVIVVSYSQVLAGYYDFSSSPAYIQMCSSMIYISPDLSGSCCDGDVSIYMMFKDTAFEPLGCTTTLSCTSSPNGRPLRLVLFLYSYGGPDYPVTYFSVKPSLIDRAWIAFVQLKMLCNIYIIIL